MEVVDAILRTTFETEPALRAMLRLSLEEALEPLRDRLVPHDFRRLVVAIAAAVGIDALVWLRDVAGLSSDEAAETMRWSARALLRAAAGPGGIFEA